MHRRQNRTLHPQVFVELGRDVFGADGLSAMQQQQHIDTAHAMQDLFATRLACHGVSFNAA